MAIPGLPGTFLLAVLLLAGTGVRGQTPPTFAIRGYQIEGNTLLPQNQVNTAVMSFTGEQASFETIQQALEALEKAYLQAGYGSVKVEVPEQDIKDGVVKLLVVEARLDRIVVEGQKFHDEANILHALPALQSGQVVNVNALQRNLDLANDNFTKHTSVTFRQSEASAQTDAVVRVVDEDPLRFVASLDNTGSQSTGRYRLGLSVFNANVFNLDHVLSAQLLTSPTKIDKVGILGIGYRIPLYSLGDALDFTLGYSNVDSGRIELFSVSGSGLILGTRYTHNFDTAGPWQQKLSVGLDYRSYSNSVVPLAGGASQVPNLEVRPISLTYSTAMQSAQRDLALAVTLTHNIAGGGKGSTAAFNQPGGRAGADASFSTLKLSTSATERLSPDWSLRGGLSAQYTNDLLISAEQFGAGGADSVRGFQEREIAGDGGARAGFEVWGPDFGMRTGMAGLRLQPIAFLDAAWVRFNVAPGSIRSQAISSIGIGLRSSYERKASFKLDYAYVMHGAQNTAGATTATGKGTWRLHGTALWFF